MPQHGYSIPSQIRSRLVSSPSPSPSNPAAAAAAATATATMVRSPSATIKPPFPAFQSHPSDLELVDSYLRPWVETGAKTGAFIHDADVYAADPAYLTRQFAPAVAADGERAWYFYTPLRHKSVHGKRKTRTVARGSGCWHNEAKSKPVYMVSNGKHQIGHRQSFSFVKKDTGVRVRTGWLMIELRLLNRKDGAGQKPEFDEDGALGNRVLCKVYRSPRNPEPSGSGGAAAASPGHHKAEAGDDESSDATLDDDDDDDVNDDDDISNASLDAASGPQRRSDDVESSEATVAAPSHLSKANDEISGGAAAAPGRREKAEVDEGSAETSAAAPPRKRKALDDESFGAASPALKKRADGSSYACAEMQCPQCGTHLVVTVKRAESKSETENSKDHEPSPAVSGGALQRGETRGSSQKKNVRFLQFL